MNRTGFKTCVHNQFVGRRTGRETGGTCAFGPSVRDRVQIGGRRTRRQTGSTCAFGSSVWGLVVAVLMLVLCVVPADAQEAIYIVRHAERASDEPQSPLSPEGHARAARLAEMLRDAGITAVFVSEYERTAQTARPTATRLGLIAVVGKADDIEGLLAKIRALGPAARVLIAGHSDTVPKILAALGDATPVTIAKGEFDNLFVVLPARTAATPPVVLRLRY